MKTSFVDLCDQLSEMEFVSDVQARALIVKMVAWKEQNPRTYQDAINYKPFRMLWQAVTAAARFTYRDDQEEQT